MRGTSDLVYVPPGRTRQSARAEADIVTAIAAAGTSDGVRWIYSEMLTCFEAARGHSCVGNTPINEKK